MNSRLHFFRALPVALALLAGLGGCARVGADFRRPDTHLPARWPEAQAAGTPVDERWWLEFHDGTLSALMQRAVDANLDLAIAATRLHQVEATRWATEASHGPQVTAGGSAERDRSSARGLLDASGKLGQDGFGVWNAETTASWEPDFWGRLRRELEVASAHVDVAREDFHAVQLAVLAETAGDYLQLRGVQATAAVTRRSIERAERSLHLSKLRFAEGVVTRLDVAEAASQLASIQARLPLLAQRQAELINVLGLMLSEEPDSLAARLRPDAPQPAASPQFALGLPSELAEHRPDIRRAEALLHAATASVGVAQGDFYPRIRLSADLGLQSLQLSDFGSWSSRHYGFGPQISLPLFDGGRLRAMLTLREGQQREAALQYQRTVLAAWHEIDNVILLYRAQEKRRDRLQEAVEQARIALDAAQHQYQEGAIDFVQVLTVQDALLQHEQQWVETTTGVSLALVQLYKALGRGWSATAATAAAQAY